MSSLLGCDGLWGDGVEVLGVGFNGQKWKFFHRMLSKAQGLSKKLQSSFYAFYDSIIKE